MWLMGWYTRPQMFMPQSGTFIFSQRGIAGRNQNLVVVDYCRSVWNCIYVQTSNILFTLYVCLSQKGGQYILWKHIENLYHKRSESGLYMGKQLKREHIYLTPFSKMRVDLAAQVTTCLVTSSLHRF